MRNWPNRDPIDESGGVNLYSFIVNDPIAFIDKVGLQLLILAPATTTSIIDPILTTAEPVALAPPAFAPPIIFIPPQLS
jgi:hypothetical protein